MAWNPDTKTGKCAKAAVIIGFTMLAAKALWTLLRWVW